MQEGTRLRRKNPGQKMKGDKGDQQQDDEVGREGTVTHIHSEKWVKIDVNTEAEWVRPLDFDEV